MIKIINDFSGTSKSNALESFETFFNSLLNKEHLTIFTYFLGMILLTKSKNDEKEFYSKGLKENLKLLENSLSSIDPDPKFHSLNNSQSNDNQPDSINSYDYYRILHQSEGTHLQIGKYHNHPIIEKQQS